MSGLLERAFAEHRSALDATWELRDRIQAAGDRVRTCLHSGSKVLLCGNGGSCADAQHIAGEIVGRFIRERGGLPAISLTADSVVLTAIGNDYGFEAIFARGVEAHGRPGDVLIGLSTSGQSANVVRAAETARGLGVFVIALTGENPGALGENADLVLAVGSRHTPRVQEMHILIGHLVCEIADVP